MGEIVDLARYRKPKHRSPRRQHKKRGAPWTYDDLRDRRPHRHAGVKFGPRGRPILIEGQVWVELGSRRLWVVEDMWKARKGFYALDVALRAYKGTKTRKLCEAGMRGSMIIWDLYGEFSRECMAKLDYCAEHDPDSPWRGRPDAAEQARNFFGFDSQGNRIRD